MAIGRRWTGKLFGTNTGNLYVAFEGEDSHLKAKIHVNDPVHGVVVYDARGSFENQELKLDARTSIAPDAVSFGELIARAHLNARGELDGEWSTTIGTAGTFVLFPHDHATNADVPKDDRQEQLHTARHNFRAVVVDKQQLTNLATEMQKEFDQSDVVVSVYAGTERPMFLPDFQKTTFNQERSTLFKLYARQRQTSNIDKVAVVEFGQFTNYVMTQGADEAWVLGFLEKLKNSVKPLERSYATSFQTFGIGLNQLLLICAIIYSPSLPDLSSRAILLLGVLFVVWSVTALHRRYLPLAALYLNEKPKSLLTRVIPSVLSWFIAVTAALLATLLGYYLENWLP